VHGGWWRRLHSFARRQFCYDPICREHNKLPLLWGSGEVHERRCWAPLVLSGRVVRWRRVGRGGVLRWCRHPVVDEAAQVSRANADASADAGGGQKAVRDELADVSDRELQMLGGFGDGQKRGQRPLGPCVYALHHGSPRVSALHLGASAKDPRRRYERKPATLHFLRRLYAGEPLGHPELHGYWDRIAATLRDRVDYLTWAGRDDVADPARENLRRRHFGQPRPRNGLPEKDACRDIDGYAEGAALYRETHERSGQLTPDLPGRLRTLAKRARARGDLPPDFLNVVKARDRARRSLPPRSW